MDLVAQIDGKSGSTSIVLAYMDLAGNIYYSKSHKSGGDSWDSSYMKTNLTAVSAIAAKPLKPTTYLAQGPVIYEEQLLQPAHMSTMAHTTSSSSSGTSAVISPLTTPGDDRYGDVTIPPPNNQGLPKLTNTGNHRLPKRTLTFNQSIWWIESCS